MRRPGIVLVLLLLVALSCSEKVQPPVRHSQTPSRSIEPDPPPPAQLPARPIDWSRSAGVFIGIQTFHADSDLEVRFAADDAVDLAWLFTHETKLLAPKQVALLVAGRPAKESSRRNFAALRHAVQLVEDERHACLNADTLVSIVREQARKVGPDGLLIVSFATHGLSHKGEHRLLTADASSSSPRGVVLARMVDAIREERPQRLLLLIDACRNAPRDGASYASSVWQPRLPETLLEDVDLRLSYAALASATPGTTALSGDGNGYFTRAILDGLRCNAPRQADGSVTLNDLATYVSDEHQQAESRIGGLGPLSLVNCADPSAAGEIVEPKDGELVGSRGFVRVRIDQPELYATVLVCASANNVCYNQNPNAEPRRTRKGEITELAVRYGGPGRFTVHAALTADREFLRGQREPAGIPSSQDANRRVHWCDPVEVTRNPTRKGGNK